MSEVDTAAAPIRLLSAATGGSEWAACSTLDGSDDAARAQAQNHRQTLDQLLTEVLLSENLIILAGLGTTLCLNKPGPRVAPAMGDLWAAAVQKAGPGFEKLKEQVGYSTPPDGDDIERLLSQCQLSQAFRPAPDVAQFIADSEALIVEKCRFVNDATDLTVHEAFLRRVARRPPRQPRTKLFTTNYDLCFETAASHTRFIVVDGFSHTQPQEFDGSYFAYDFVRREQDREIPDYIPNVFHLYKIHGSVDWELRHSEIIKTPDPAKPLIIYPRHTKFEASYDQPFIEMMSRFQVALRQPNSGLLLLGVGFNDPHVW